MNQNKTCLIQLHDNMINLKERRKKQSCKDIISKYKTRTIKRKHTIKVVKSKCVMCLCYPCTILAMPNAAAEAKAPVKAVSNALLIGLLPVKCPFA